MSTAARWWSTGEFAVRDYPSAAAKVTRAIPEASAKWVQENPKAAAELGVEKKYITARVEINTQALLHLKYVPGVAQGKRSVERAAEDMKRAQLLGGLHPSGGAGETGLAGSGRGDRRVDRRSKRRAHRGRSTAAARRSPVRGPLPRPRGGLSLLHPLLYGRVIPGWPPAPADHSPDRLGTGFNPTLRVRPILRRPG